MGQSVEWQLALSRIILFNDAKVCEQSKQELLVFIVSTDREIRERDREVLKSSFVKDTHKHEFHVYICFS